MNLREVLDVLNKFYIEHGDVRVVLPQVGDDDGDDREFYWNANISAIEIDNNGELPVLKVY